MSTSGFGGTVIGIQHAPFTRRRSALSVELLALIPGLTFMVVFVWRAGYNTSSGRRFTLIDDAMISMTYARTLAQTGDWVWFPGAERVQGITNPLWTLYMALLQFGGLSGSSAAVAVSLTGVLMLLGCALVVCRLVRRSLDGWRWARTASVIAGGSLPFLYPLTFWTLRGMEVGLLALLAILLVLGISVTLSRWQLGSSSGGTLALSGLIGVLGIATRLDFALIVGALSLWMLWWAPRRASRLAVLGFMLAPPVIVGVLTLIFQQVYWGDWLTNTYRLKLEGFSLWDRISRGSVTLGKALPVLVLAAGGLVSTLRLSSTTTTRRLVVALATVALVVTSYSVWVGGDAWEEFLLVNRYIAVSLPACIAVTMIGVGHLMQSALPGARKAGLVTLAVLVASGLGLGAMANPFRYSIKHGLVLAFALALVAAGAVVAIRTTTRSSIYNARVGIILTISAAMMIVSTSLVPGAVWLVKNAQAADDDARESHLGEELQQVTMPDARIAVLYAGAPGYYAERPMIDLLGKSDRRIATEPPSRDGNLDVNSSFHPGHNKWDFEYSIGELRPDVVAQIWGGEDVAKQLSSWGYEKLCLPDATSAYVRSDSTKVRWNDLPRCPT